MPNLTGVLAPRFNCFLFGFNSKPRFLSQATRGGLVVCSFTKLSQNDSHLGI